MIIEKTKLNLSDCSRDMQEIINICLSNSDGMCFIEEDDSYYTDEIIDRLRLEATELGLEKYFEFSNCNDAAQFGEPKITVYYGILDEFFDEEF